MKCAISKILLTILTRVILSQLAKTGSSKPHRHTQTIIKEIRIQYSKYSRKNRLKCKTQKSNVVAQYEPWPHAQSRECMHLIEALLSQPSNST